MPKHRTCTVAAHHTFCSGRCPFADDESSMSSLRVVKRNGGAHLCDGSGELLVATGEDPADNLNIARVLNTFGTNIFLTVVEVRGR